LVSLINPSRPTFHRYVFGNRKSILSLLHDLPNVSSKTFSWTRLRTTLQPQGAALDGVLISRVGLANRARTGLCASLFEAAAFHQASSCVTLDYSVDSCQIFASLMKKQQVAPAFCFSRQALLDLLRGGDRRARLPPSRWLPRCMQPLLEAVLGSTAADHQVS
jgi:hypothetical protein